MFLSMDQLFDLYVKIRRGTATAEEITQYDFVLLTTCCKPEYIVMKLEKQYQETSDYDKNLSQNIRAVR